VSTIRRVNVFSTLLRLRNNARYFVGRVISPLVMRVGENRVSDVTATIYTRRVRYDVHVYIISSDKLENIRTTREHDTC